MIGYAILISIIVALVCSNCIIARYLRMSSRQNTKVRDSFSEMLRFLHLFSHNIVNSKDEKQWMQSMAGYVADAIKAQFICIYLAEQERYLRLVAKSGEKPGTIEGQTDSMSASYRLLENLAHEQIDFGEGFIGEIAEAGKYYFENFPTESKSRSGTELESVMILPIIIEKRNTGVICAINKRGSEVTFSEEDRTLLESLSNPIAVAGSIFQIYADWDEQQRIQQELRLAREIQNSLIPKESPNSNWFNIYGVHKSAKEVSGDFYDFVEINDDFLLVLIADASGKGVPACMIMAMCRTFIRANAARFKENLEGLLTELNRNLFNDTDEAKFVTLACCLIDKRDCTVEYARAGHTELLIRQSDKSIQVISPDGPALGLLPPDSEELAFDTFAFSWLPNTSLMLFTDGLSEALNDNQSEFGLERLIESYANQPDDAFEIAGGVLSSVKEFSQCQTQTDDQTIVILTRNAESI